MKQPRESFLLHCKAGASQMEDYITNIEAGNKPHAIFSALVLPGVFML